MALIDIKDWVEISESTFDTSKHTHTLIGGVYALGFYVDDKLEKIYYGSSEFMYRRFRRHMIKLKNQNHINKYMQRLYDSNKYVIKYYIVEECSNELEVEIGYIQSADKAQLINVNVPLGEADILPYLQMAKDSHHMKEGVGYIVDKETDCWESTVLNDGGYGRVALIVNGKQRHFKGHRLMYWIRYGEYPPLLRHICNNKKCMNPDHLETGSCGDNLRDVFTDGPYGDFEEVWLEYNGCIEAVHIHYGWGVDKGTVGNDRCNYYHHKLKLSAKYPEITKLIRKGQIGLGQGKTKVKVNG